MRVKKKKRKFFTVADDKKKYWMKKYEQNKIQLEKKVEEYLVIVKKTGEEISTKKIKKITRKH